MRVVRTARVPDMGRIQSTTVRGFERWQQDMGIQRRETGQRNVNMEIVTRTYIWLTSGKYNIYLAAT